jgi:hypothetical protein
MKMAAKWFVVSGATGVLVPLILYVLGYFSITRQFAASLAFALCPAIFLGNAEPTSLGEVALLLSIVLGANFVLYGFMGFIFCGVWTWIRNRSKASERRHQGT